MEPKDLQEGLRDLIDREFLNSEKFKEQQHRVSFVGAHPKLQKFFGALQRKLGKLGVPMFVHEVWRTQGRQDELFKGGFSQARWGESPHNFGCALDLVHSVHGWQLTPEHWRLIGHVGKEVGKPYGVVWGGDWKFYDPAHWELKGWREVAAVMLARPGISSVPEALQFIAAASEKRALGEA